MAVALSSVRRLLLAASYVEENEALRLTLQPLLSESLNNGSNGLKSMIDLSLLSCEPPILQQCGSSDDSRSCSQSLLEELLLYLVIRKFGGNAAGNDAILSFEENKVTHWQQRDAQQLPELQSPVGSLCELLLRSDWDAAGISALGRVVKRLQDPQVRQRFLGFAFQILRCSVQLKALLLEGKPVQLTEVNTKFFDEAVRVLLLGVTDLWSAVRKDCAKNAAAIVPLFPLIYIEMLMDNLLCVSIGSRSVSADKCQVTAWTEREGALLTLSLLLRSIQVDIAQPVGVDPKVSQVKDDIKIITRVDSYPSIKYRLGSESSYTVAKLPKCLVQTLKPAMYQCLRHDQLSIRQLAAQCMVDYAALCEEPTRLLTFQEVISKLNRIHRSGKIDDAADSNEPELLDAFDAEGLLEVLARIVPCLPSGFLLKHWKYVFPTLEKYVTHIASSVRQQSSSVVLALAKLSLSNTDKMTANISAESRDAALKLMVQMLLSLSKKRDDESGFCWQQKEGRLLSIEALVNVLGESLLHGGGSICELLRWNPVSTRPQERRPGFLYDLKAFCWAHEQFRSAMWVVEDEEIQPANDDKKSFTDQSLIQLITAWVDNNVGNDNLPASSSVFWQQVLEGCILQSKEAFESPQFELRRISRQLLPGLMRFVIWTDQLDFLSSTQLKNASTSESWSWACMKCILLHLRYLDECVSAFDDDDVSSISIKLASDWMVVWNGILAMEKNAQSATEDTEALVAKVEVEVMVFLCFGEIEKSRIQLIQILSGALQTVHVNLPESVRLSGTKGSNLSGDSSVDRQFSLFMVPLLPAVVTTFHSIIEDLDEADLSAANDQTSGPGFQWMWLCLERIVLAWLLCDDMFRWITLNKSDAQSQLVESLRVLFHFSKVRLTASEEQQEFAGVVKCLSTTFLEQERNNTSTKSSIYMILLEIHLQMWMACDKHGGHCSEMLLAGIAHLYSQRQQQLASSAATKKLQSTSTTLWDDWDEDDKTEIQQATPVSDSTMHDESVDADPLFEETMKILGETSLHRFNEALRTTSNLPTMQGVPGHHVAKMQQQVEARLKAF